jgi:tRNA pseudouridine55 synthase
VTTINGLVLVDKPAGLTSHDVVAGLRKIFTIRRIGHAGTLDPMATGLLVVALGPATRLLRFAQAQTKRYTGTVLLGSATDTLDAQGIIVETRDVPDISSDEINAVAAAMTGTKRQVPPMVSALKVGGRRLHEMARQGLEVERAPREIIIHHFGLSATTDPARWDFDVTCSVGTYVRVLLSDLALELGTLGHLTALRRTSSGSHDVADAHTLDELARLDDPTTALLAPQQLLDTLESVVLDVTDVSKMRMGQRLDVAVAFEGEEIAAVDDGGHLVGVLRRRGALWKPEIVMSDVENR